MDLETTVRELARRLLGYCLLRTGNRGLAEEIAQVCLAALVQRWRRHGEPDAPDAFVFAIARRRCRRAVLRRRLWLPLERAGLLRDPTPDIEARLVRESEREQVVDALKRLPRTDRELLLLLTVGGLGLTEAAAVLRISVAAAKMRSHRARKRLRDLMEDHGAAHRGRHGRR